MKNLPFRSQDHAYKPYKADGVLRNPGNTDRMGLKIRPGMKVFIYDPADWTAAAGDVKEAGGILYIDPLVPLNEVQPERITIYFTP